MVILRKLILPSLAVLSALLLVAPPPAFGQVSPAEIVNPRLKELEAASLDKLTDLNAQITAMTFPFPFALRRYVGLDPGHRQDADTRGLEFVKFHDLLVLKVSGNYGAALNAEMLSQNQRANQVLDDVITPILPLLVKSFSDNPSFDAFDAFGFEISYHVRTRTKQYGYEGKENLVIVFSKPDALAFLNALHRSTRQEIIDRSQVYLDGKELGLALGEKKSFDLEQLDKGGRNHSVQAAALPEPPPARPPGPAASVTETQRALSLPEPVEPTPAPGATPAPVAAPAPVTAPVEVDAIQKKYQPQLDQLTKDGLAQFHFVSYAPATLGLFHNRVYLQITVRNPELYDKNATSIYKRAAQSFDLFLAPQLKDLLAKIPAGLDIVGVDFTVLDQFSHATSPSGSSEALEYICPLQPLRQFADADITNQELIQQSIVLVNGVRIALNLQQVE